MTMNEGSKEFVRVCLGGGGGGGRGVGGTLWPPGIVYIQTSAPCIPCNEVLSTFIL